MHNCIRASEELQDHVKWFDAAPFNGPGENWNPAYLRSYTGTKDPCDETGRCRMIAELHTRKAIA